MTKTTNSKASGFIERLAPFQANSASADWYEYMPSTGRLPAE